MTNYDLPPLKVSDSYPVSDDNQPQSLQQRPQWVVWKPTDDGQKIPRYGPHQPGNPNENAGWSKPENWLTFNQVVSWVSENSGYGLGFVLTEDDPFVLVDIDECRDSDTGELDTIAKDLIDHSGTWADVSVSGTGIHLLGRGEWDREWHMANLGDGASVEVYDSNRFAAMSGRPLPDSPDRLTDIQDTLDSIPEPPDERRENSRDPCLENPDTNPNRIARAEAEIKDFQNQSTGRSFKQLMDLIKGHHGDDRSAAEFNLAGLLYGIFRDCDDPAGLVYTYMDHVSREIPYTTAGDRRKWLAREPGYREFTVEEAIRRFDPEKWRKWRDTKASWDTWTDDYGDPVYDAVLTAVQPHPDGHYLTGKAAVELAQQLNPSRSEETHKTALRRLQTEYRQVKMAFCPDRENGKRYVYYPAHDPDPDDARWVKLGGEKSEPG